MTTRDHEADTIFGPQFVALDGFDSVIWMHEFI